jgi:2-octaprenyl-6-methoxyphenol hydroxylase
MKKQKICIIGGGLTGLVTAISLSKLSCEIDLITGNVKKNFRNNGTVAISEKNLNYLTKLNISKSLKKVAWPCSTMKLYSEIKSDKFSEILELNNNKKSKKILYMIKNSKISQLLISKIKKINRISVRNAGNVSNISNIGLLKGVRLNNKDLKYNLVIICTGPNSHLVKKIFKNTKIESSYNEESITTTLSHNMLNNNIARQIFLNDAILALLPLSRKETSVVWSIKKKGKIYSLSSLKSKIKKYSKNYLQNIKFKDEICHKDLHFLVRNKLYQQRTILFGDALHLIHPFAGQGFNMTLRDLASLEKILKEKINLGLDIGTYDVLSEYSKKIKARNFAFSVSLDVLKSTFSINNKYFKNIRNNVVKKINKNNFIKDIFFSIANKGFKF